jgi:hypothetical protein
MFAVSRAISRGNETARRKETDGRDGRCDTLPRRQRSLFFLCSCLSFCLEQVKGAHDTS